MAVRQSNSQAMQLPLTAQVTEVTISPSALSHYITDEELAGLSEMHQDPVKDICLAAIGCFVGAVVPAFDALSRFGSTVHPMTIADMVSVFVASVTLGAGIVTGFLWFRVSRNKVSSIEAIRKRPKMSLVRT